MPESSKEFVVPIGPNGDFVRVVFVRDGKSVPRFSIQYEARIDGIERPVVRFDTAHGSPHRDLLAWDGNTIAKSTMRRGIELRDAMTEAIEDLEHNWSRYRDDYLLRRT